MNGVREGLGIRSEKVKAIIIIHATNSDNFDFNEKRSEVALIF